MVTGSRIQCRASHIKPRYRCTSQEEQANVFNGLLLNPAIDELFDKGIISFDEQGQILLSSTLIEQEIQCLGLSSNMKLEGVRSGHHYFLQYHRRHIFLDGSLVSAGNAKTFELNNS